MTTKCKATLAGAALAFVGLASQQTHADPIYVGCNYEEVRATGIASVSFQIPTNTCPIYGTAHGVGHAYSNATITDQGTTSMFFCDPLQYIGLLDSWDWADSDPVGVVDSSGDVIGSPISLVATSTLSSSYCESPFCDPNATCNEADAYARANVYINSYGTSIVLDGVGNPFFKRSSEVWQELNPPAPCLQYLTVAKADASYWAMGDAEFEVAYETPCMIAPSVHFNLESDIRYDDVSAGSAPIFTPADFALVRFASITVNWIDGLSQPGSVTYQGVFAEPYDGATQEPIRLGQYDHSQFDPYEVSDGWVTTIGMREIPIPAPASGFYIISVTSSMEEFDEFDGDIDGDGLICQSDETLIMDLMVDNVQINDPRYTPRADFDLDGDIDALDTIPFFAIYNALPDCNENGNPDACDLALGGIHVDRDSNGVLDECELAACCLGSGGCEVMHELECDMICGTFNPQMEECGGPMLCGLEQAIGACCLPTNECALHTECECDAYNGVFYEGVECSSVNCN